MSALQQVGSLRRVLLADAITSGASGLLLFGGASFLAGVLALPEPLLRSVGLALLPFAVFVAYIATRAHVRPAAVWTIIVINVLWAFDSIVLLLTGWVTPNGLGYGFVLFQAIMVAGFAELQFLALRRSVPIMV